MKTKTRYTYGLACITTIKTLLVHSPPPFFILPQCPAYRPPRAYMRDPTFYLAKMLPLPLPRLDVDIGRLLQTDRNWSTLVCLRFSHPPETQIAFGQDRLTEVGYGIDSDVFQALLGFVLSMCYSILERNCDQRCNP